MLINLKTYAAKDEPQQLSVELKERLPVQLGSSCAVNCQFSVQSFSKYYLIRLELDSILTVICQRCLDEFSFAYHNQTELAVCDSEKTAEELMSEYECIVAGAQIDLQEVLTDDLHLYAPLFHPEIDNCDHEIDKFISLESE